MKGEKECSRSGAMWKDQGQRVEQSDPMFREILSTTQKTKRKHAECLGRCRVTGDSLQVWFFWFIARHRPRQADVVTAPYVCSMAYSGLLSGQDLSGQNDHHLYLPSRVFKCSLFLIV